jgi:hypothetical protein
MSSFPLAIGRTGRYLVTPDDEPFLVHGEAAWSLASALRREEAARYVDDRSSRGVNAVIVNLVERLLAPNAPANAYGVEPFITPGNLGTPNPAYFEHVDWLLGRAAELGILVLAVPCYLGYPDPGRSHFNPEAQAEGWYDEVLTSGVTACEAYGNFLGERYADAQNVLWMIGGDRNPGRALEHMRAVVRGIRSGGASQLFTAHVLPEHMVTEVFPDDDWLEVTTTYTYGLVHQQVLRNYNRLPVRPTFLVESTYENEHNASEVQIRRQAWWALLSGACGQCVGTYPVDVFQRGWENGLDSPAIRSMSHLKRFFESYPWWDLVPDSERRFLVGGFGELRGLDRCCAAVNQDRTLAVAYMPSARPIELNLFEMSGETIHATWFDPIKGASYQLEPISNTGICSLSPPGDQDWAVAFQSSAVRHADSGS